MLGARVTDEVDFHQRRGSGRWAVRAVRCREPDKFRWRSAVASLNRAAARMRGLSRMRIEEPVREMVLDMPDRPLQREVVIDARRCNVDLDRGEILSPRTFGELRRMSFLIGTELSTVTRWVSLPDDWEAPIDTAGVVVVGRAMADMHRRRAQKLWLQIPDPDGPFPVQPHHRMLADRARYDADRSRRWSALARELLGP